VMLPLSGDDNIGDVELGELNPGFYSSKNLFAV